jgi:DNA-binding PadR family transcriptional regulator
VLAIDARDSDLMLVMPHRHGGVASMLVALEDAGLGVSRIEPRIGEAGTYRLTVQGREEVAVTILEGIGCTVTPSPYPPTLS